MNSLLAHNNRSQSGNAFFIVMLGVVLFGALIMVFSRGSRQGADDISSKKAQLYAQEILTNAQKMERSVNRILSRGISESDLSFEAGNLSGYTNGNCADDTCKVFASTGGGAQYIKPDQMWLDPSLSGRTGYGDWLYTHGTCITNLDGAACDGTASSDNDLIMLLPYLKRSVCEKINSALKLPIDPIPTDGNASIISAMSKYQGSFDQTGGELNDSAAALSGKNAGCFLGSADSLSGAYSFYSVLITR